MIESSNVALAPEKTIIGNKPHSFALTFPSLSHNCKSISFSEGMGTDGFIFNDIILKDSGTAIDNKLTVEDISVTDDASYSEGLIIVEKRTEKAGSVFSGGGVKRAITKLQERAASLGCCLIVITEINSNGNSDTVTGILYRRP